MGFVCVQQPHQAEPQNLSAPGGSDKVSAMVSAYIQTTPSDVPTSQQVSFQFFEVSKMKLAADFRCLSVEGKI